jgi:DNA invertase Pin-like site-specific DNA recombinase
MKAVFLWKPIDAPGDVQEMLPVCIEKARSIEWTEDLKLFSEGYGAGKSWDDLMAKAHSGDLTGVILHDLSKWHGKGAVLADQLSILGTLKIPVAVALMDYDSVPIANLAVIADSSKYYSRLRSKSIRVGMQQKKGGRPPFGMSYDADRKLVSNEDWAIVTKIFTMNKNGLPTSLVSQRVGLSTQKVRNILRTHGERFRDFKP